MRAHLLVFKGSPDDALDEAYAAAVADALGREACTSQQVAVLSFERLPTASTALPAATASSDAFSGVIVTSARAVWAIAESPSLNSLLRLPWFVVGPATARATRELGASVVLGESSGSAQELFTGFIKPRAATEQAMGGNFLFLCGDMRRPTIPELLSRDGIRFLELVVYRTVPLLDGEIAIPAEATKVLALFFSPSGVNTVLKWTRVPPGLWDRAIMVAIGPTTAQAMPRVDGTGRRQLQSAQLAVPTALERDFDEYAPAADAMTTRPSMPSGPEGFTEAFLTQAFQAGGALPENVRVIEAEKKALGGESGNTGAQIYRIALKYSSDEHSCPPTVILKWCDTSKMVTPTQRANAIERGIIRSTGYSDVRMIELETSFYSYFADVFTKPVGLRTPRIFYCGMTGRSTPIATTRFILFGTLLRCKGAVIMEDLSAGITFDAVGPVEASRVELILTAVAKFHGNSAALLKKGDLDSLFKYQGKKFMPIAFNYDLTYMSNGLAHYVKLGMKKGSGIAKRVKKIWGDTDLSVLNSEPDTFEALKALETYYRPNVHPMLAKRRSFPCVLQGDLHAGNYYFMGSAAEGGEDSLQTLCMFDWQMWGIGPTPVQELQYFFSTHMMEPSRTEEERLLRIYHEHLEEASGMSYPFEMLQRDFDVAALDNLAAYMVRRGKVETPKSVARSAKQKGAGRLILGIQRLLTVRETILLKRARNLFLINPTFSFA